MKKILLVMGSPRVQGNTYALYSHFKELLHKDGIIFAIHLYENGYITLGDDEHPGIRPIRWYEPLFLVRLMEKIREIYYRV